MYHYYMFHKPFGCVTARRDDHYPTVMDYFSELHNDNLNPVGRLDRETTGLLLITDDGMWNQKLTHPAYHKEKTYEFTVLGDLTKERIRALENGVLLKGAASLTSPARITITGHNILSDILPSLHPEVQASISSNLPDHPVTFGTITITEGKKRQIRRMMKSVHCCVIELKRISIGSICLDPQLKPGEWKEFFPD
ncbi:MAG: pseudouridine synthase [Dorea sp.]|uniref:pseudouridine synthase n=1 Tax=Dorea sp. YH-dor226 TaxID=3151119 RepID=UPI003069331A|nr:pseudouridine synthase [Dorea sp.]